MSSSTPARPLQVQDYTIGWICALPIELAAAEEMLDETHPELSTGADDDTIYTLGRIGAHNIVMASLPGGQTGTSAATSLANRMLAKFTSLRVGLMVGVGGGVPTEGNDIRLGDVVVSLPHLNHGGVIQYDLGKAEVGGMFRRTGHLNTPTKLLLNVVNKARASYLRGLSTYFEHLSTFDKVSRLRRFTRSRAGPDLLYSPSYDHSGGLSCEKCRLDMLVKRPPRDEDEIVRIHYGTIASGNQVIKDATTRDELAKELGGDIMCFEMEAAGLMNDFRCLVVRGICDYADSHKQKGWQPYAAATAAAYAKELLSLMPAFGISQLSPIHTPLLLPFHRNPQFTGRKEILDRLTGYLHQSPPPTYIAIHGLGGSGKSAVALEFAYRVRASQPHRAVFWLPAIDQERFRQAYREIALLYEIPDAKNPQKDIMDLVRRKLSDETTGEWLMIIDNSDDPNVLLAKIDPLWDYLPHCSKGTILFTTRSRKVAVDLASNFIILLDELEPTEAHDLFQKSIPRNDLLQDEKSVSTLLQILTYIPLAIVQAVAFMNSNDIAAKDYLKLLQGTDEDLTAVLSRDFRDHNRYADSENPIARTWYISFHHIQTKHPLAAECLSFIACIASVDIPEGFLLPHKSELDRVEAIGTLTAYRFLTSQQDALFDVHPLVHLAMRNWLKYGNQWTICLGKATEQLHLDTPEGEDGFDKYDKYQAFTKHAMETISVIGNNHDATSIRFVEDLASCRMDYADYEAALSLLQIAMKWKQKNLGLEHPDTLETFVDLTHTRLMLHDFGGAEILVKDTINSMIVVYGATHRKTLNAMRWLAIVYYEQERFEEAEELLTRIPEIGNHQEGEKDDTYFVFLRSTADLAVLYCIQGRSEEAEQLLMQTIHKSRLRYGEDSWQVLVFMSVLADTYRYQGRLEEATDLAIESLQARKRTMSWEDPDVINCVHTLASLYVDQGRLEDAEELLTDTLEALKPTLGTRHYNTLRMMEQLAEVFQAQGRFDHAEETLVEIVEIRKQVLGLEKYHTLSSMSRLASVHDDQGRFEDSGQILAEILDIRKRSSGSDHQTSLQAMKLLAFNYADQDRLEEAEKLLTDLLEIQTRVLGPEHKDVLGSMCFLTVLYERRQHFGEAKMLGTETLKMHIQVLGLNDWSTLRAMGVLAAIQFTMGEREAAVELMERCVTLSHEVHGDRNEETEFWIKQLGQLRAMLSASSDEDSSSLGEDQCWSDAEEQIWSDAVEEV